MRSPIIPIAMKYSNVVADGCEKICFFNEPGVCSGLAARDEYDMFTTHNFINYSWYLGLSNLTFE
jgi:hypothetical protein